MTGKKQKFIREERSFPFRVTVGVTRITCGAGCAEAYEGRQKDTDLPTGLWGVRIKGLRDETAYAPQFLRQTAERVAELCLEDRRATWETISAILAQEGFDQL